MEGLATHGDNPAEFSELERLVIRYAEQLTATAATDEALDADLRKHLSDRELVERALAFYREQYGETGLFENDVYDGVAEMLDHVRLTASASFVATLSVT